MNRAVFARLDAATAPRALFEERTFAHRPRRTPTGHERNPQLFTNVSTNVFHGLRHETAKEVTSTQVAASHYIRPTRMFMSSAIKDRPAALSSTMTSNNGTKLRLANSIFS